MPTNNAQVIKMPLGTYEFGANLVSNQVQMPGQPAAAARIRQRGSPLEAGATAGVCVRGCAGQHDGWQDPDGWEDDRPDKVSTADCLAVVHTPDGAELPNIRKAVRAPSSGWVRRAQVRLERVAVDEASAADGVRGGHVAVHVRL